ncbi:hypothetical protein LF817_19780 [Halobacillus sp. A1]|uniref:hypothetical protein n=1 Tax=Halobacillus sp. A1 TaxID=2880262 RepID=UPI0020A689B0|nr:hypothetical protein [Halobacillus sp. A1]MCP3033567.1 hypothetical protein [Halobacillus sp. A1]
MTAVMKNQKLRMVMVFTMILTLVSFSLNTGSVNAAENDPSQEEVEKKSAAILSAFSYENGQYEFDETIASEKGLTEDEIYQTDMYFQSLDHQKLAELQSAKNNVADESGMVGIAAVPLLPAAVVAFLGTLAVTVGWKLADEITGDFYKYGVTKGCQMWDNVGVVEDFCKINDYL